MTFRDELEAILTRRPSGPEDAERVARAAELLARLMRAEDQARRFLDRGETTTESRGGGLAGLTLQDAAERVLEGAGTPLHVRELGKRIKGGGWSHPRSRDPREDQINYQLAARLPRHPDRFRRVGPNTFGLATWGSEALRPRPKPRLGLFEGDDPDAAGRIGEHPEEAFSDLAWHSS